ncbi:putative acyltransferase [Vanrija pseudolonga]|uniref:Purtative acyltransferase n=1 Tax=Vanrija pseudolonga TaxID=143232 RepID=A0AAF1BKZ9_9TREE|nr:purtative acyltransferase [Vanrija pseudolonga]
MYAGFVYDFLIVFWRLVVLNIFFREIRPRGAWNIPKTGPVIFIAAPHANQFLDPLLLFTEVRKESGRRVSMLTAAKSMERAFIGFIARLFNSIPVSRAADYAKTGAGTVRLSDDSPHVLLGKDTKFTTQVKPRSQIVLPKNLGYATCAIEEVISDTEIRIKGEFTVPSKDGNSNIKATNRVREGQGEGVGYKILPHIDQDKTFGAVFQALNKGGCIGIFPEGGSHDRTDFLPLKAGFSIMALGAMATHPGLDVKIVPVGLSYFNAHKFRSRAVVEFGTPITVDAELVAMYKQGGAKKREACGKLLEQAHDGLRAVTLRAPDFETLQVIQAARRLYRVPGQHLSLGQTVQLSKYFMEGYLHYQHEPGIIELRERVLKYNRLLRDMGIADHQVERASNRSIQSLLLLLYRTGLLLWWGLLSLPGVILHAPVFILAKVISHKKAKEALAASSVKIQGRDVLATWKVLVSLAVVPALYLVYTITATVVAYKYDLFPTWRQWLPVVMFCLLPSLGYAALKFGEAGMDVFKSLRPLFLSLWPGNQREVRKLKEMREELINDISEKVAEFGPKLYENFDKTRMLPNATTQKSKNVESSVLSHPILWLDERIFGWNRRGSAIESWEQSPGGRSEPPTAPGSPHDSDVEEEDPDVDYDDILAVVETKRRNGGPASPRKRAGRSYSDLTQARLQPTTPSSPLAQNPLSLAGADLEDGEGEGGLRLRSKKTNGNALGLDVAK